MSFFIVSGLSGSGKTIALQALEDIGFYCIDNLPAVLLPHFSGLLADMRNNAIMNVAIGLDVRNRAFLADLPKSLGELRERGIHYRIIFLQAEDSILVKRFKETRRRHPMLDHETPLVEAIDVEKKLLEPLSFEASLRIDTTRTTPHELRMQVSNFARGEDTAGLTLLFESFGYKHGTPLDADFVFDVRCLPNPHYDPQLRPLTGRDAAVVHFLETQADVAKMASDIRRFIADWLPSYVRDNRSYLTVAIGCTGGQHRSVYLAEWLAREFRGQARVLVRHRAIS